MKLRSTLIIAVAIAAPIFSGLALNANSQSIGNEAPEQTEVRRGRGRNLSPEEREAKRAEKAAKMKELLGLSDSQASQIEAIREKYRPQKDALRQEAQALRDNNDREGMQALRAKKDALKTQMKGEIKEILTDEQRQTLEEHKAQRKGRRGGRRSSAGDR